jgi:predicted ATPase
MVHKNYYVITGGPGVGKTTLLHELEKRNYRCMPEAARRIIQEQMAQNGDALPWKNTLRYKELMLEGSVSLYLQADPAIITFFDRGIPDVMAYAELTGLTVTDKLTSAITSYRYNPTVFILPPWKEIYETDNERKQTWEEAVATFDVMKQTYSACGYTLTEVPPLPVAARADFILRPISLP